MLALSPLSSIFTFPSIITILLSFIIFLYSINLLLNTKILKEPFKSDTITFAHSSPVLFALAMETESMIPTRLTLEPSSTSIFPSSSFIKSVDLTFAFAFIKSKYLLSGCPEIYIPVVSFSVISFSSSVKSGMSLYSFNKSSSL